MTGARLGRAVAAELVKLRSLPAFAATVLGTVLFGAAIAAAYAAMPREGDLAGVPGSLGDVVALAIPYAQLGMIVLGILPVGHETGARVLRTSFAAVPVRGFVVAGKTVAVSAAAAVTSLLAVAVSAGIAALVGGDAIHTHLDGEGLRKLAGAALALVLVALLAHALALLLSGIVPSLTAALVLLVLLPPLLAGLGETARWLPDRAAAALYSDGAAVPDPLTGFLVAAGWIGLIGVLGALRFSRSES